MFKYRVAVDRLFLTGVFLTGTLLSQWAQASNIAPYTSPYVERQEYRKALSALRAGQTSTFRAQKKKLQNYLLAPYLDYYYLNSRISSSSAKAVTDFIASNPNVPAADILKGRWLRSLGKNRQWRTFRTHYDGERSPELNCYYLRALYGTGEKDQALANTANAWIQPDSQPKACDPLFEVWRTTDHFTESVVWQRLSLALQHNEVTLARYLQRYFSDKSPGNGLPSSAQTAEAFYQAHVNPQRLSRAQNYRYPTQRFKTIVAHGISRLSRRSPERAAEIWRSYSSWDYLSAAEKAALELEIAIGLAKKGQFPPVADREKLVDATRFTEIADAALKEQNWSESLYWIDQLPPQIKQESKWQYWLARSLEATMPGNERARLTYESLATQRHYYGFLAAQKLGTPGAMNASTPSSNALSINQVKNRDRLRRSLELKAVGDNLNSRREWFAELKELDQTQQILAAELAKQNGLITLAILTANEANARNHLHLRFPIGFEPQFRQASLNTGIPAATLVALARQESAMDHAARSHADAYGLMQLLPSTAKLVARRHGKTFSGTSSLYDPGTNISLGSSHLAWLLKRYNGQIALAFAGYNAGEHRVDRSIKGKSGTPIDVWIETIPFRETRNYVKNVLAFRHVYAERLNTSLPMLTQIESVVQE